MKSSTTVVRVVDDSMAGISWPNTMNNSMASLSMAGVTDSQRSMAGASSHGGTVIIRGEDSSDGENENRDKVAAKSSGVKSGNDAPKGVRLHDHTPSAMSAISSVVPIPEEEEAVEIIQSKADLMDKKEEEIRRSKQ